MTVAALLLAAGESTRMGRPKPLLKWQGRTLIEYQIEQLRQVADDIVVVLGHRAEVVRSLIDEAGVAVVVNERFREGRASSVRLGADSLRDGHQALVVLNVDQPRPADVLRRLIDEHVRSGKLITVPVNEGNRGHPPVFAGSLLADLRDVREESLGLREVMRSHAEEIHEAPFDSDIVLQDLNTPEEYEVARQRFAANEVTP